MAGFVVLHFFLLLSVLYWRVVQELTAIIQGSKPYTKLPEAVVPSPVNSVPGNILNNLATSPQPCCPGRNARDLWGVAPTRRPTIVIIQHFSTFDSILQPVRTSGRDSCWWTPRRARYYGTFTRCTNSTMNIWLMSITYGRWMSNEQPSIVAHHSLEPNTKQNYLNYKLYYQHDDGIYIEAVVLSPAAWWAGINVYCLPNTSNVSKKWNVDDWQ